MEALSNTPDKIFAKVHGRTIFPSSSTSVSWQREICLSGSSNRRHLGHLMASLPHCKAFCYLPVSNSEFGRQTETAETNIKQTPGGSKFGRVRLELKKECQYGEHFLVVGDDTFLGSWNPSEATPLSWSDGHIWTVDLDLPVGRTIQYKFICKLSTSDIVWQPGQNRSIQVGEGQNVVVVTEDWENAETQSICVEQLVVIKQDEPIVDTPKTKTGKSFAESSFFGKKLMLRAKNSFSVPDAYIKSQRKEALSAIDTEGSRNMSRSAMRFIKGEMPARRSERIVARNKKNIVGREDEAESIVICDEGHVLVPGLTAPVTTEDSVTKELRNPVLASSCDEKVDKSKAEDEGETLVSYDEGHVLVPGLTAQMISEEALTMELQKSVLANSLNGADESVNNTKSDW